LKKPIKKKEASGRRSKQTVPPKETAKNDETEEKRFDFGGLPNRNLKKNLGC
jgi:hypothetical protein